jgi:hypothetical protein
MDSVGLQRDLYDTLLNEIEKSSVQTATPEWKGIQLYYSF